MAIPFDITAIEKDLELLNTKNERLEYLGNWLFELKKKQAEMEFEKKDLSRLIEKTQDDYTKYIEIFDSGKMIFLPNNNPKMDKLLSNTYGFKDIDLLKKRISLETKFEFINSKVSLAEGMIERETSKNPVKEQINNLNTLKEHWEPLWIELKAKVSDITDPLKKIEFLQDAEHDYVAEVISTPELFNSSGDYIDHSKPKKIGMDAQIENEIKRIRTQYGLKETTTIRIVKEQTKPNNSFKLKYSVEFESILNKLKANNYLANEIKVPQFKKIFNEAPLKDFTAKINWQGSIASLRYFISLFPIDKAKRWHITAHCFTCDGKDVDIKQLNNAKQRSDKDKVQIDNIAKRYLTQK